MSYVPISASIAAAQTAARRKEEEEQMTGYSKKDLDGWEFKIVRSPLGSFRNYKTVQKVTQEEARAGWELVEKFDDHRIRFKRRLECRANDGLLETDPYRTNLGIGSSRGMIVAGVAILVLGVLAAALVFLNFNGS